MPPRADDLLTALRSADAIRPADLDGLADWLGEDVAQRLFAVAQDLAERDLLPPDAAADLRRDLLAVVHDVCGVAEALRGGPAGIGSAEPLMAATAHAEELGDDVRALAAQSRLLAARTSQIRRRIQEQREARSHGRQTRRRAGRPG